MRITAEFLSLIALLSAVSAHAGFRHPVEQSGAAALAVQNTPAHPVASASAKRMMPDRMPSQATQSAAADAMGPINPAKVATPAAPVTRAPDLPSADHFGISTVKLPSAPQRDGLVTIKPESPSLKGTNRAQIHAFLKQARALKLPKREYGTEVKSRVIVDRYRAALNPTPYRAFRTAYQLGLAKIAKIQLPGPVAPFENMIKRLDALFDGVELRYPPAILALWQLTNTPSNARNLQARDALFAGILSERAGWSTPAGILFAESAMKRVELEERYQRILWKELDNISDSNHVEDVIAKVNPRKVAEIAPVGDKANFAMVKRMMFERPKAPQALNPAAELFAERIRSTALRDRVQLLRALTQMRHSNEGKRQAALESLKSLEKEGDSSVQQDARWAFARALLQKGSTPEALELYQKAEKNGKNRLEILAEQTYAEYLSGHYQDSLGKSMGLQSPYFQFGFAPDIHLVEILSRNAMCDFGGAEAGVRRFAERYVPELKELEAILAKKKTPRAYYEELISYHGLEQPMRYQRFLLQLPAVMANQKTMNHALDDLGRIDRLGIHRKFPERPQGWDSFAASMRSLWTRRAQDLRQASAESALLEAAYLAKRLRHTFAQVELLDLDISTSAAKNFNLQSALNFPARKIEEAKADEEKFRWPFENEVWEDEIDFMKARNPSKCAMAAAH